MHPHPTSFGATWQVFELFARHRCKLLRWLDAHPAQRNVVMEAIVRTVTCTGPRNLTAHAARAALRPRRWVERPGYRGLGRYIPDTALAASESALMASEIDDLVSEQREASARLAGEGKDERSVSRSRTAAAASATSAPGAAAALRLEAWLRRTTANPGADVEVNLQLGEFSLRRQALTPLPREVASHADFVTAFGESRGVIIQSVQVSATSNRRWLRLVGERHDIKLWSAPRSGPQISLITPWYPQCPFLTTPYWRASPLWRRGVQVCRRPDSVPTCGSALVSQRPQAQGEMGAAGASNTSPHLPTSPHISPHLPPPWPLLTAHLPSRCSDTAGHRRCRGEPPRRAHTLSPQARSTRWAHRPPTRCAPADRSRRRRGQQTRLLWLVEQRAWLGCRRAWPPSPH